jgi:CMD domain protein
LPVSSAPAVAADAIDAILGVADGGPIAALRGQRPHLATEMQAYYLALFEPEAASAAAFSLLDRFLVAVRVASHTGSAAVADWYADLALANGAERETLARVRDVAAPWSDATRLGAAIRHADLLTLRPVAASPADLQALKDAGYTPAGILSLSQTVAFVNYQVRLIAGLRAFGASA